MKTWMWSSIGALGIVAGSLVLAPRFLPTAGARSPVVRIDPDSYDFGHLVPGSYAEKTFVIKNEGTVPLEFGEIHASCGCTKPVLPVRSLAPGATTELKVGFSVSSEPGEISETVSIPTNDPSRPQVTLAVFAESWVGAFPVPRSLNLGTLRPGGTYQTFIQLQGKDNRPFRITDLLSDVPGFQLSIDGPADAALPVHRVLARYTAGETKGSIRGSLKVVTDRHDARVVAIPFVGEIVGPVSLSPSSLQIAREDIGTVVKRVLLLKNEENDSSPKVREIKLSPPWELIRSESRTPGSRLLMLELDIRFPTGDGTPWGQLELRLDSPDSSTYMVPLLISGWTRPISEPTPR
jgi:hypothetical protein